jgi:hypothetical protein
MIPNFIIGNKIKNRVMATTENDSDNLTKRTNNCQLKPVINVSIIN